MELTDELAIKIAKKYNFVYDEELKEIVIPNNITKMARYRFEWLG